MQATRLIIRPDTIPYQRLPCDDMDEIRGLFSRMKKGRKDNKRKSKEIRAGVDATSEGASPTSMLSRPVLHAVVGGVRDQEDYWADVEGKEASRKNLRPDSESGLGPSREGSDVDGKRADRSVDPPHSPPSAPSTYVQEYVEKVNPVAVSDRSSRQRRRLCCSRPRPRTSQSRPQ